MNHPRPKKVHHQPDSTPGIQLQIELAARLSALCERHLKERLPAPREGMSRLTYLSAANLTDDGFEEFEFDIVPTILITSQGPMFVDGPRSRDHTFSDWLNVPEGADSRASDEHRLEAPLAKLTGLS